MSGPNQPAWLDDPDGSGRLRYWDGQSWTDRYANVEEPSDSSPLADHESVTESESADTDQEVIPDDGYQEYIARKKEPQQPVPEVTDSGGQEKDNAAGDAGDDRSVDLAEEDRARLDEDGNLLLPQALPESEVKEILASHARRHLLKANDAFSGHDKIIARPFVWIILTRVQERRWESDEFSPGTSPGIASFYNNLEEVNAAEDQLFTAGLYHAVKEGSESVKPCYDCSGSGEKTCPTCYGDGRYTCTNCHQGFAPCWRCHGAGKEQAFNNQTGRHYYRTCPSCHGARGETCYMCHGDGRVPCGRCDRSGVVTCPTCRGRRQLTYFTRANLEITLSYEEVSYDPLEYGRARAVEFGAVPSLVLPEAQAPWGLSEPLASEVQAMLASQREGEVRRQIHSVVVPATMIDSPEKDERKEAWIVGTSKKLRAKGGFSKVRLAIAGVFVAALAIASVIAVSLINQANQPMTKAEKRAAASALRAQIAGSWKSENGRRRIQAKVNGSNKLMGKIKDRKSGCSWSFKEKYPRLGVKAIDIKMRVISGGKRCKTDDVDFLQAARRPNHIWYFPDGYKRLK